MTAMDHMFQALSHRIRREMLRSLSAGEMTVGALAEPFDISLEAASKHVKILERAGIVRRSVQGRRHVCRLDGRQLAKAGAWLAFYERFWTEKLDDLDRMMTEGADGPQEES